MQRGESPVYRADSPLLLWAPTDPRSAVAAGAAAGGRAKLRGREAAQHVAQALRLLGRQITAHAQCRPAPVEYHAEIGIPGPTQDITKVAHESQGRTPAEELDASRPYACGE